MPPHNVLVEVEGPVLRITLNRPEKLNALTHAMHDDLQHAFDRFQEDDRLQIAVLCAAPSRAFCVGSDLAESPGPDEGLPAHPASGYGGIAERFDLTKPVVAEVGGFALGGGLELVLACDIVVATADAIFGLPEPLIGGIAIGAGVHRLARQVGLKAAMGMILTGRKVGAGEALAIGLVTEVVEPSGLREASDRWVCALRAGAPTAVRASKEAVMRGLDAPTLALAVAGQHDGPAMQEWWASPERFEGTQAFLEKRNPSWLVD